MSLKGKHTVSEIEGIRCTIVENGVSENRMNFIKDLLEFNKYEVKVAVDKKKVETDPNTYTVGVTDIVFNFVIALYQKRLKTKEGKIITPSYWEQWKGVDYYIPYYEVQK